MFRGKFRIVVTALLVGLTVAAPGFVQPACAALVESDRVVKRTQVAARDQATMFMAREDVAAKLENFGVAPEKARARAAALSDEEIDRIAGRMDILPAGDGLFATVLIAAVVMFLVLLLTDLVGLTKLFSFTRKDVFKP